MSPWDVVEFGVLVVDGDLAFQGLVELNFGAGEAEALGVRGDLKAESVPLHDIVVADDAFMVEAADAVQVCWSRSPGFLRIARSAGEATIVISDENGSALDLNALNDSTNGLLLKDAIAINDAGQILCSGVYPGAGATILLTPAASWIQPVTFAKGRLQGKGTTQTITVTNAGTNVMPGSISIALDGLTSGLTLTNAVGTTQYAGPIGSPYVNVSSSDLAVGATTSLFTLTFSNPAHAPIKYTARVLTGSAPR